MSETNDCAPPTAGSFSWNELVTNNSKASESFYSKLFGWQTEPFAPQGTPPGAPPYTIFKTAGMERGVAGMMQAMIPGTPTHWVPYVVVANADASFAKAVELGAKVLLPVMTVGEVGRVAVIQDPQGATIGLHELARPSA